MKLNSWRLTQRTIVLNVCHCFVDKLTWNVCTCGLHNIPKCKYYATFICPQVKLPLYIIHLTSWHKCTLGWSYVKCTSFTCAQVKLSLPHKIHLLAQEHMHSLVPRLSPRTTTMNSKEGESLVPLARDATEQTSWIYQ